MSIVLNFELVSKYNSRQKELFKALLQKRGIEVDIIPLDKTKPQTYDDFDIEIESISSKFERGATQYSNNKITTKMLLQIDGLDGQKEILSKTELLMMQTNNYELKQRFNNISHLRAFFDISKLENPILENGVLITIKDFPNMTFIVSGIEKQNLFDEIYQYRLGRT